MPTISWILALNWDISGYSPVASCYNHVFRFLLTFVLGKLAGNHGFCHHRKGWFRHVSLKWRTQLRQTFACTIYEDTFGKGMMFDELGQTDRFHRCLDRKQDVANQVLSTGCFKIWSTISQTIRGPTSTNADSSGWVCSYLIHRILLKRIDLQVPHIPKMYLHLYIEGLCQLLY